MDGKNFMGANDDVYKRTKLVPRVALHYELFLTAILSFFGLCIFVPSLRRRFLLSIHYPSSSIVPLQLC